MHVCVGPQTPLVEKRKSRVFSMTGREYGKLVAAARAEHLSINEYVRRTLGLSPETDEECHRLACSDPQKYYEWRREEWKKKLKEENRWDRERYEWMKSFGPDARPTPAEERRFESDRRRREALQKYAEDG